MGFRLLQAHNIEIMFKNLQHIIRGYVQHGIKDDKFTGAIDVVLEIKDSQFNPAMIDALKTELDDMFDFLTNQCSSLGFRGKDNSAIRLNYEVSA